MRIKQIFPLALTALMAVLIIGCGKNENVASPSCAELDKVKDPAQREELLKKCPRGAPGGFKPSEKREW